MKLRSGLSRKMRVVVFGSFKRGYAILRDLLMDDDIVERADIVGLVTDNPLLTISSPQKRVWQHVSSEITTKSVESMTGLAHLYDIPVFDGVIKSEKFYHLIEEIWQPDIAYMGTFGQRLNARIIETPRFGVFNAHPGDGETWPSCVGPNPFEQMLEARNSSCAIALHTVDEKFDNGELVSFSAPPTPIPYGILDTLPLPEKIVRMHELTAPHAADLVNAHLRSQLGLPLREGQACYAGRFRSPTKSERIADSPAVAFAT